MVGEQLLLLPAVVAAAAALAAAIPAHATDRLY